MSFALFLLILLVATGAVWALESGWLARRRAADGRQPWWVEYSISFFPVILTIWMLSSKRIIRGPASINWLTTSGGVRRAAPTNTRTTAILLCRARVL